MQTAAVRMALACLPFAILALASVPAAAQDGGPAIGHKAPSFDLNDQNGAPHSLDSLLSRGRLAIVFYRSADW